MGLPERGVIRVGAPADLILFRARGWSELLSRPEAGRVVLRAGRPIDTTLPDHRELDDILARSGVVAT
jgi:cytosine deaminase